MLQDALRALEMPRFTRRYPAILETLMKQMLNMVHVSDVSCDHMSHVSTQGMHTSLSQSAASTDSAVILDRGRLPRCQAGAVSWPLPRTAPTTHTAHNQRHTSYYAVLSSPCLHQYLQMSAQQYNADQLPHRTLRRSF